MRPEYSKTQLTCVLHLKQDFRTEAEEPAVAKKECNLHFQPANTALLRITAGQGVWTHSFQSGAVVGGLSKRPGQEDQVQITQHCRIGP